MSPSVCVPAFLLLLCSSAAGGSSKGPAVVDKRGQEQKCPHCEKIYTQSGRLKEHIASKHANAEQEGQAEQSGAAAAAGPSTSAAASTSCPPAPGAMMELGSRGGYFTSKSPKVMLQEWLQREKRPRARYQARPLEDGTYTCKVGLGKEHGGEGG